ncbi:hypothetical protein DV515_00019030 [Chloebia gouldiae]|uniref:Agouti domain-containing protein n=1 Tax=Chloebia gouldiae TaxID=44316 RepID=A0A3L8Q5X3_CHLGU|nr:hypothetical protein DV515_00019030 [Chloebia gouldiae]
MPGLAGQVLMVSLWQVFLGLESQGLVASQVALESVGSELVASVSDADPSVRLPRAGLQGAAAAASAGRAMKRKGSLWVTSAPSQSHSTIPPCTVTVPCPVCHLPCSQRVIQRDCHC